MEHIVLITLNKKNAQPYIQEFEASGGKVDILLPSELDFIDNNDFSPGIICILEDNVLAAGEIGQLILSVKKYDPSYLWVFSLSDQLPYRLVYSSLGADGTICVKEMATVQELIRFSFHQIEKLKHLKNNFVKESFPEKQSSTRTKKTGISGFKLKESNLSICIEETEIFLTRLEFRFMSILNENLGRAVTYQELGEYVWSDNSADWKISRYRTANIVYKLRCKIEKHNKSSDVIQTVRSMGYRVGSK
ncbi:two-component system, OmpR family, alkaline phosphatase synthesis response regulator PhoP [Enterococcus sp. 7F3_DIV0205]|uniref:Two-component system, OmpR family, alkaline phosphatase synthesis response regulator PhoP n=1 Tax=Candidatus Enterococcus palustris TaxID=1834189 RepID=A0AAQ3Y5Q6_9ENTE|nr:helix-turn-helix domain-containing protein [Enterococcus sp. 7F3_DIV0205]OTN82803.1 hypothetical protein A5821_002726 [Enterococcus sp. 7F3_DIV0205]